jgi:hypothetical protein
VVYVWASWSRDSVELLPSVLELQREYEPLGIEFVFLSLDIDSAEPAVALMTELEGPHFYRLTVRLEEATSLLQISEPPAILGYSSAATEPIRMEPGLDEMRVAPADAVVVLEELLR